MRMTLQSNLLKYMFRNVYFINGTAYAGKSTMVRMLAEAHDGICCGENYHNVLMEAIDEKNQPNLSYFDTMKDWQEFVNRTPEEYARWISGCSEEATELELIRLLQLTVQEKKIFVDTNISCEALKEISDYRRVAIMLALQSTSVDRFFDRADAEKQFILKQIQMAEHPEQTMQNYRKCLEKINSIEVYRAFEASGFFTLQRDDSRTPQQTMALLERHFGLASQEESK